MIIWCETLAKQGEDYLDGLIDKLKVALPSMQLSRVDAKHLPFHDPKLVKGTLNEYNYSPNVYFIHNFALDMGKLSQEIRQEIVDICPIPGTFYIFIDDDNFYEEVDLDGYYNNYSKALYDRTHERVRYSLIPVGFYQQTVLPTFIELISDMNQVNESAYLEGLNGDPS